jgi:hypothetical protein
LLPEKNKNGRDVTAVPWGLNQPEIQPFVTTGNIHNQEKTPIFSVMMSHPCPENASGHHQTYQQFFFCIGQHIVKSVCSIHRAYHINIRRFIQFFENDKEGSYLKRVISTTHESIF